MTRRAYYSAPIRKFLIDSPEEIIGQLAQNHPQDLVIQQTGAWKAQIAILKTQLQTLTEAHICFELLIPRMGKRADVVVLYHGVIFVLEFKVSETKYNSQDVRQTQSYALDLSCFHEASHHRYIIPILVATNAPNLTNTHHHADRVFTTLRANQLNLLSIIDQCVESLNKQPAISADAWLSASYKPTPTIIEAAQVLYSNHTVEDITRNDAGAINLAATSDCLNQIIQKARSDRKKCICFVTGVPGAGKTLAGLKIATDHNNPNSDDYAVFLSGNGPLVEVLREALARDKVNKNTILKKSDARRETDSFIQNIHHFRDESLENPEKAPVEKVVIFDEAQRAWDQESASKFMRQKRGRVDFNLSEPEFLISVMDRHREWCVIVALIGGGQEINQGEAGLNGWFQALAKKFPTWNIFYSNNLMQAEYAGNDVNLEILRPLSATALVELHLATPIRSFRAESLSYWVDCVIHNQPEKAAELSAEIQKSYPIYVTRNLLMAKNWIKQKSRGLQSCGLMASSGAKRLKPEGIYVNDKISAADWFLNDFEDVRSCHFLEDTATEFVVQGLELDWCLVAWDADYRYQFNSFQHWKFSGSTWKKRHKPEQQRYLENAYRVLLTRARQGMVIYVPGGNINDKTRIPKFYDETYDFLLRCGAEVIQD
jgi:hypothetical protein